MLPVGIEDAQLPNFDISGYVYFSSGDNFSVSEEVFHRNENESDSTSFLTLTRGTLIVGDSMDEVGGALTFASMEDAATAWRLFESGIDDERTWGLLDSPQMYVARGSSDWTAKVRVDLESNQSTSIRDHDENTWNIITNLPESPTSRPLAVGALKLDRNHVEALGEIAGVDLSGIRTAFRLLRVGTLAFGVYADSPIVVTDARDEEFLRQPGFSILLLSKSSYPGPLVDFLLGVAASRIGMDTITLGNTNARYTEIGEFHVLLKNQGSVMHAVLANTRQDAEDLLLSALSD